MKYTLLYIYIAAGLMTLASCSSDDDTPTPIEQPQPAGTTEDPYQPVSWRARAYTPGELQAVEDAISAIRGAGYTY